MTVVQLPWLFYVPKKQIATNEKHLLADNHIIGFIFD
jgi:hypothetical protein